MLRSGLVLGQSPCCRGVPLGGLGVSGPGLDLRQPSEDRYALCSGFHRPGQQRADLGAVPRSLGQVGEAPPGPEGTRIQRQGEQVLLARILPPAQAIASAEQVQALRSPYRPAPAPDMAGIYLDEQAPDS